MARPITIFYKGKHVLETIQKLLPSVCLFVVVAVVGTKNDFRMVLKSIKTHTDSDNECDMDSVSYWEVMLADFGGKTSPN